MKQKTPTHTQSTIVATPAESGVRISGFMSICSCGEVIRSSLRECIEQDVRDHARWHAQHEGRV